jgi:spoIIIJ-associated protein
MTDKQQFSGKNLEDALQEAANEFGIDKAFVCYNILNNNQRTGFLAKFFSSKVQIEAWVETAKEDLQEAARKAVREALNPKKPTPSKHHTANVREGKGASKQRTGVPQQKNLPRSSPVKQDHALQNFLPINDPKVKEVFQKYNEQFFSAFRVPSEHYSIEEIDNQLVVHVQDEFLEDTLTKSDKLSLAYEHVFKRIAQKCAGDVSGRLTLNAGSSAEKRHDRLIGIAKSLADKVKKTGKSVVLASKSSQERRVIHLALDGLEGIGTRSVGLGDKRRLVIFASNNNADEKQHQNKKNNALKKKPRRNHNQKKKNAVTTSPEKSMANE